MIAASILAFGLPAAASASTISSTFDTDADGWLISGDASSATPNYVTDGGPAGTGNAYISANDSAAGGVWYFQAAAKFTGDRSSSFGQTLTFDLKQSSLSSQFDAADILLVDTSGLTLSLHTPSNPGMDWTSYATVLDAT